MKTYLSSRGRRWGKRVLHLVRRVVGVRHCPTQVNKAPKMKMVMMFSKDDDDDDVVVVVMMDRRVVVTDGHHLDGRPCSFYVQRLRQRGRDRGPKTTDPLESTYDEIYLTTAVCLSVSRRELDVFDKGSRR